MSGLFEEREKGYEAKWAHDEETHFRVLSRRNILLGRWAAGELGLLDTKADEYAMDVVRVGLTGNGADPVFEKIKRDFDAKERNCSARTIHHKMEEFFHVASDEMAK